MICPECDHELRMPKPSHYVCDRCGFNYQRAAPQQEKKEPHPAVADKPDLSLLPGPALRLVAIAMKTGADKYGRDDWRRPDLDLQGHASKAIRHIYEWLEGRDADPESGVDPLAHAAADLLFVIWHNQNWTGIAKRPGAEVSNG